MISAGLVSVTFRQLSPRQVIELVRQAGLTAIEWGGDVHVPHGDLTQARAVRAMSENAGLEIPTYGSYYRVGHPETGPFEAVLETAVDLGAPTIRVWAGRLGTAQADEAYALRVVEDTRRIVDMAADAGVTIAYEFHGNTLADSYDSVLRLLHRVERGGLRSLWQPPKGSAVQDNLNGIDRLAPWIQHIHVFSWVLQGQETLRLPLDDHAAQWQAYFERLFALPGDRNALLEFVRNDDPQQFLRDAATIQRWLSTFSPA